MGLENFTMMTNGRPPDGSVHDFQFKWIWQRIIDAILDHNAIVQIDNIAKFNLL